MFRIGIIGCGRIVEDGHVPAFKELPTNDVKVVALADVAKERVEKVSGIFGIEQGHLYTDYREMLAKEKLDFVDIALPHFLHEKVVIDAANAEVNIISEKPLATNLKEVDRILKAVKKNKVILAVLHNYRYYPAMKKAIEITNSGVIGERFIVRSEGLGGGHYPGTGAYDPDWRTKSKMAGGGCLIDNGYHNIYVSRELMGADIVSVYAQVNTYYHNIDVDDSAFMLMKHSNGGTTSIQISWAVKAGGQAVNEVHGKKGSIVFGKEGKPLAIFSNDTNTWNYPDVSGIPGNSFTGIFQDIFQAVKTGARIPTDGYEARRNLQIIIAAYESARKEKVIKV